MFVINKRYNADPFLYWGNDWRCLFGFVFGSFGLFFCFWCFTIKVSKPGLVRTSTPRRPGSLKPSSRRRGRRRSAEACSKQRFYQDLPYYFIQKRNEMINPEVRPEKFDGQEVGRPTWCHLLSEKSIDSFAESRHKRPVNKKL